MKIPDSHYWQIKGEKQLRRILDHARSESLPLSNLLAKNVILFIGDGMGTASITAARILKGQKNGKSGEEDSLEFDEFPNVGLSKTYNVNKQVPDSAGTATALFTGVKTNYGVIGMDIIEATLNHTASKEPTLTSIVDWAIAAKKRTGFVTTTRVTHATPGEYRQFPLPFGLIFLFLLPQLLSTLMLQAVIGNATLWFRKIKWVR